MTNAAPAAGAFRALRHPNFRLYAVGQAVSLTGSWLHNTALSWLVYRLTHSEWMLGLMSLLNHLPMLLLGPLGGWAADRFPRRRLVLITQSVFLCQAALLAWLSGTGRIEVWQVFALGSLYGVANAFDIPARQAMLLDMTGDEDLISAIGLNSMIFNLARILGPSLAGIALAQFGEPWCFALNAFSFSAVLLGLAWMRFPLSPLSPVRATWAATITHLRAHPSALTLLLLCAALNIAFSGVFVLNPFFAEDIFRQGPRGLGFLMASMGVGAVVGTYLLAKESQQSALPRVSTFSGLLIGGAFLIYAVSNHFILSLGAMALAGGSLMRQNAATNSVLQSSAPAELRGRIVSLFGMAVVGMAPIGAALSGALSRATAPRWAAAGSAIACLVLSAWAAYRLRRLVLLFVLLNPLAYTAEENALSRQVKDLLVTTSKLTGLSVKRSVPAAYMTRPELERYLAKKMKEDVDPKAIALEEIVIKRLGLAPADFDLKATTLALLSEQAAAFYDFETRKLFIVDVTSAGMGPELLVHELGHALQDQHFGLRKFLKAARDDDDAALARMAVMEGQAMYLMAKAGERPVEAIAPDDGAEQEYPVLSHVPLYLKESLLFPYEKGLRFQAAVCAKYQDCISRVFQNPPLSSAQILHPELYFSGRKPELVAYPAIPGKGKWKMRAVGNLGEFDFELILRTHKIPTRGLTDKWRGGGYRLLEEKKSRDFLLQHASYWEDDAAAASWLAAYLKVMEAKSKSFRLDQRTELIVTGSSESGAFRLRREGSRVFVEEGLPLK